MNVVRRGAAGHRVKFLQRLLNKAMARDRVSDRHLRLDGSYGERTENAVIAFQQRHPPLSADGIVGANTWHALGLQADHEHRMELLGQPTDTTCWSAAASMILGDRSVSRGEAVLTDEGRLARGLDNLAAFARSLRWRQLDHTPEVPELVEMVMRTPVWIAVEGEDWGHAVAISGVYSDNASSGDGTMFRIHDPWPAGQGRIYGSFADPITILSDDNRTWMPASLETVLDPRR
jgi:hypothetical protein